VSSFTMRVDCMICWYWWNWKTCQTFWYYQNQIFPYLYTLTDNLMKPETFFVKKKKTILIA